MSVGQSRADISRAEQSTEIIVYTLVVRRVGHGHVSSCVHLKGTLLISSTFKSTPVAMMVLLLFVKSSPVTNYRLPFPRTLSGRLDSLSIDNMRATVKGRRYQVSRIHPAGITPNVILYTICRRLFQFGQRFASAHPSLRLRLRSPVSIGSQGSTYASVSARRSGVLGVDVDAEAHRVLPGGVLSGFDVGLGADGEPSEDGSAVFVDDSTAPAGSGQGWTGTVAAEELQGGGLHRHVCTTQGHCSRVSLYFSCLRNPA